MTNEIALAEPKPKPAVVAGGKLQAFIPSNLDEAWRLAAALAASGMTPKAYGADQNKIMVGIMAGAEVGLTPFSALQSIAVIGNNPSLWGDGALALVQASGLLVDMEETVDGDVATCRMVRRGRQSPIARTFSMDDARKAGLAGKAGPWTQYPARMLQMRARAWAMRDGFADVLKGLHIVEEARDYAAFDDSGIERSKPLTAGMLIEQSASAAEQPAHVDPALSTEEADASARLIASAANAKSIAELDEIEARFSALQPAMDDDTAARVDAALNNAAKRIHTASKED